MLPSVATRMKPSFSIETKLSFIDRFPCGSRGRPL
jgi:hypothetical protein